MVAVKSPSTVKVLNLSDQGGYILPKISESSRSRKAWVNYGITSADDFFTELIKAYETSPTNQACIDSSTSATSIVPQVNLFGQGNDLNTAGQTKSVNATPSFVVQAVVSETDITQLKA